MTGWLGIFIDPVLATLLYIAMGIAIDHVAPRTRYTLRARLLGIQIGIVSVVMATAIILALSEVWRRLGVPPIMSADVSAAGLFGGVVFALLLTDLAGYWLHRLMHWKLWPLHAVHHSQTELHAANNYTHVGEKIVLFAALTIPLSLFQFDGPAIPIVVTAIVQFLQFYIHSPTECHFGPLRTILVDNRFHRIHHSVEARHHDRNFGILVPWWDMMFGTAYWPARDEWPDTGVPGVPPPTTVWEYLAFPVQRFGTPRRASAVRLNQPV